MLNLCWVICEPCSTGWISTHPFMPHPTSLCAESLMLSFSFLPINDRTSGKRRKHVLACGHQLQLWTATKDKFRQFMIRTIIIGIQNRNQARVRMGKLTKTSISMCSRVTSMSSSRAARVIFQLILQIENNQLYNQLFCLPAIGSIHEILTVRWFKRLDLIHVGHNPQSPNDCGWMDEPVVLQIR